MKLGACWIGDGVVEAFPGLYRSTHAITVHPPWGVLAPSFHGFEATADRYGNDSVHGGLTS